MIGTIVSILGKGLAAGAAGTAAMTGFQLVEMRITGREPSTAPAEAVEKVFDIEPETEKGEERLSNAVHWGYGSAWGIPRALLGAAGIAGPLATGLHFAAVWTAALVTLPRLRIAPPVKEWGGRELALDALRHLVYASAAGAAYAFLDRGRS